MAAPGGLDNGETAFASRAGLPSLLIVHTSGSRNDTSGVQQEEYFERLRKLTPEERLNIVSRLNCGVRRMAMMGLKLRHPEASEDELRVRLVVRIYGRELAQRIFADIPADAV